MKHLSRVLSLALVIALSLSLIVVTGAIDEYKDYTDIDQIDEGYIEAIDVLSALGALKGYKDDAGETSLKPKSNVTRAEAAVLVTRISIGVTAADRLTTTKSTFSDVGAAEAWAKPAIEFAVERGIINGVGDGKFNPNGSVTGAQFAKLMLTALGYGARGEYVGSSWELNTIADGQKRGILTVDTDYSSSATREEVIQYMFNTISPRNSTGRNYLVKFSNIINDYVLADSLNIGVAIGNTGSEQYLGEETFGLIARSGNDEYGYAGHNWALNTNPNKHITGFYKTDVALGENKAGVPIGSLTNPYDPGFIAFPNTQVAYYLNGRRITVQEDANGWRPSPTGTTGSVIDCTDVTGNYSNSYIKFNGSLYYINRTTDIPIGSNLNATDGVTPVMRKGVIVTLVDGGLDRYADFATPREFYPFDSTVDAVIIIEKTVHDVAGAPVVDAFGAVRIPGVVTTAIAGGLIDYPKDLAAKDVVLMHQDGRGVTHIEKATSVTGKMTYINKTLATVTVEGSNYSDSGLVGANAPLFGAYGYAINTKYLNLLTALYLDDGGFSVRAIPAEPAVPPTYGFVVGYESAASSGLSNQARVLLLDNTNTLQLLIVAPNANGDPDITGRTPTATPTRFQNVDPVEYIMKDGMVAIKVLPTAASLQYGYTGRAVTITLPTLGSDIAAGNYYITSETAVLYSDDTAGGYATSAYTKVYKGYTAATKAFAAGDVAVSAVVEEGARNLLAIYFNAAAPEVAPSHYFFLADGRVDVSGTDEHPIYQYDVFINGTADRITTLDFNLLSSTEIRSSNAGLYIYDGNNADVKKATQIIDPAGVLVIDRLNYSGSTLTYIGYNGAQGGISCTTATKYYEVVYQADPPYFTGSVTDGIIVQPNSSLIQTVEGVELNNDGTAKAVYFKTIQLPNGIASYLSDAINYADAYNRTLNVVTTPTPSHGITSISIKITAAQNYLNGVTQGTDPVKLKAANEVYGAVASFKAGLDAAKTKVKEAYKDATITANVTDAAGTVTQNDLKTLITAYLNTDLAGATAGYISVVTPVAFESDNRTVTITFADGTTDTWVLTNTHTP